MRLWLRASIPILVVLAGCKPTEQGDTSEHNDASEQTDQAAEAAEPLASTPACSPADLAACEQACTEGKLADACLVVAEVHERGRDGRVVDFAASQAAYEWACELGDRDGCAGVGFGHSWGLAREQDPALARSLFEDSCAKGSALGCFGLGDLHADGRGVAYDAERAYALYERACAMGELRACSAAAVSLQYGYGVAVDERKALERMRQACTEDEHSGCVELAWAELDGLLGFEANPSDAFAEFERLCADASGAACYAAGTLYQAGRGTAVDLDKARERYAYACTHEYLTGCSSLALMAIYQLGGSGETGPQDPASGLALLERSCERGDYLGCHEFATLYARGERVEQDLARAEALYTRMCEIDYSISCLELGRLHLTERGERPKDVGKAVTRYVQACDKGVHEGCLEAGWLLILDSDVRDEPRARGLFETACEGGTVSACSLLARMFERGQGGPIDLARARELYQRACDEGDQYECIVLAHTYLDADAGHGPPDQGEAILDKLCREATPQDPDAFRSGAVRMGAGVYACDDLGRHFSGRDLVRQDLDKARALFERGCELGYDRSCLTLGEGLVDGQPFPPDPAAGLQLLARAAELSPERNTIAFAAALVEAASPPGDPDRGLALLEAECRSDRDLACAKLRQLYRTGTPSMPADLGKAVEHAERECFRSLGDDRLHATRVGWACVEAANLRLSSDAPLLRDGVKIVAARARACEIQPKTHCFRLARLYETGELETVPRDEARAKALYEQACTAGDARACPGTPAPDVDCLLDPSLRKCKPAAGDGTTPAGPAKPPHKLGVSQIAAGIDVVKPAAARCGAEHDAARGTKVGVKFSVEGATGKVISATVLGEQAGTPLGDCVRAAAEQAEFPQFEATTQGFTFNFRM